TTPDPPGLLLNFICLSGLLCHSSSSVISSARSSRDKRAIADLISKRLLMNSLVCGPSHGGQCTLWIKGGMIDAKPDARVWCPTLTGLCSWPVFGGYVHDRQDPAFHPVPTRSDRGQGADSLPYLR